MVFTLHDTFKDPKRTVTTPPYKIQEAGWVLLLEYVKMVIYINLQVWLLQNLDRPLLPCSQRRTCSRKGELTIILFLLIESPAPEFLESKPEHGPKRVQILPKKNSCFFHNNANAKPSKAQTSTFSTMWSPHGSTVNNLGFSPSIIPHSRMRKVENWTFC